MFEKISFEDEEGEHNVLNLFLEVVGQSRSVMLVESFVDEEELAKTARSCHLATDLFCQEVQDAWWSEDCWKVRNDVLE